MEDSSKKVWTARLLALLVMSLGPATIIRIIEPAFKQTIEIKTNENVGEIITAVEKLGLKDIKINTTDTFEGIGFLPSWVILWVILFLVFSILLALYHAIYCIITSLLNLKEKDNSLLRID